MALGGPITRQEAAKVITSIKEISKDTSYQNIGGIYIEDGETTRTMWGKTSGTLAIEDVTFPNGGFADVPTVTFSVVGSLSSTSINSISSSLVTMESQGTQVKHWIAKGLKP